MTAVSDGEVSERPAAARAARERTNENWVIGVLGDGRRRRRARGEERGERAGLIGDAPSGSDGDDRRLFLEKDPARHDKRVVERAEPGQARGQRDDADAEINDRAAWPHVGVQAGILLPGGGVAN